MLNVAGLDSRPEASTDVIIDGVFEGAAVDGLVEGSLDGCTERLLDGNHQGISEGKENHGSMEHSVVVSFDSRLSARSTDGRLEGSVDGSFFSVHQCTRSLTLVDWGHFHLRKETKC